MIMRLLILALCLTAFGLSAHAQNSVPLKCAGSTPFKYRIAYSYRGAPHNKDEAGSGSGFWCLEREIKTEDDWNWLQKKMTRYPTDTHLVIMSAVPVSN